MVALNTTLRRQLPASGRRHMALRIPEADLAIIDQLANQHRMTRTDYMIRASTGELADPTDRQAEHDRLEERVERLEQLAFGNA
jgi:uncharacterized protein (DUF1778 family)